MQEASSPLTVGAAGIRRDFTWGPQSSPADLYRSVPVQKESGATAFLSRRLYPLLLKQGARHYPLTGGSIMGRVSYAATRIFVLRDDSGKRKPNTSYLLRALTSAAAHSANRPSWAQFISDQQRSSHP